MLSAGEFFGDCALFFLEHSHCFLCCFGFLAAAFFHGTTNRIGLALEIGGGIVVFKLQAAAKIVECKHTVDGLLGIEAFHGQTRYYIFGVGLYLLYGKHLCLIYKGIRQSDYGKTTRFAFLCRFS